MTKICYLAGAMSGVDFNEQVGWRIEFENRILNLANDLVHNDVRIFNPCIYYNFEEKHHKDEKEPFEYDLYSLKRSDIVVANLNKQDSIGTCMELAIAKDNRIPVIGLHENDDELHPWIAECCTRVCDSMDELVEHVFEYYIV